MIRILLYLPPVQGSLVRSIQCPGGEIGRHATLRGQCRKVCWFESSSGHIASSKDGVFYFQMARYTNVELTIKNGYSIRKLLRSYPFFSIKTGNAKLRFPMQFYNCIEKQGEKRKNGQQTKQDHSGCVYCFQKSLILINHKQPTASATHRSNFFCIFDKLPRYQQ